MLLADVELEPEEVARRAGLVCVSRDDPGWSRRRCGQGFTYLDVRDRTLRGDERSRVEDLVIPPAWTDVWICEDPDGHLQAAGLDDAGRWQYLYHPDFRDESERAKYLRLGPFGAALEGLRARVLDDLRAEDGHRRMTAAADRLGNTRAIARQSYLSPVVVEAHRDGRLEETWARTRTGKWASRAERTVMRLH